MSEALDQEIEKHPYLRQPVAAGEIDCRQLHWLDVVNICQEWDQLPGADGRTDDNLGEAYDARAFEC